MNSAGAVIFQVDSSSVAPTMAPVTLAPLGPGETFAPTPGASDAGVDADTEGSGAPGEFECFVFFDAPYARHRVVHVYLYLIRQIQAAFHWCVV